MAGRRRISGRLLTVDVLWRILGFHLLAEVGARLPAPYARMVSVGLLVTANLVPVVGVWLGWMTTADVFWLYWLETAIVGAFAVVRIVTATNDVLGKPQDAVVSALFFAVLYALLTGLYGLILSMMLGLAQRVAGDLGVAGPALSVGDTWLYAGAGLFVSHLFSLLVHWFGRGERHAWTVWHVTWSPFLRIVPFQLLSLLGVWVLLALLVLAPGVLVVLLVGVKVLIDVALHLLARRRAARALAGTGRATVAAGATGA